MKRKNLPSIIIVLLLNCYVYTQAQSVRKFTDEANTNSVTWNGLRASFFADNGVHPGARLGTSLVLAEKEKSRKFLFKAAKGKAGNSLKIVQFLIDGQFGFYNHPNNHSGLLLGLGASRIRTKSNSGQTFGISLEANYLRRIYNIPTVELNENGTFQDLSGAGNNGVSIALAPSIGKVIGSRLDKPQWHIYLKPQIQLIKYDFGFFPNAAIELGIGFHPNRN